MLRDHRVDDTDEGLVRSEETVTAGEDVALEPALAHMLGKIRVHDAAFGSDVVVLDIDAVLGAGLIVDLCLEGTGRCLECRIHTVGHRFVRPEDTEVPALCIQLQNVADIVAEHEHILCLDGTGRIHLDAVLGEVGKAQIL